MNDTLDRLTDRLKELPGIGPRAARRLAFWLVRRDSSWVENFARTLTEARREVSACAHCKRLYPTGSDGNRCNICASEARDPHALMLVEKDVDLENIERTGSYKGLYFVLGGTTSPLDKEPERKVRVRSLLSLLTNKENAVEEIIFALSATTEGEDTATYLEERLQSVMTENNIKVSKLGRGLSTGTELEYVDRDTMQNALQSRK